MQALPAFTGNTGLKLCQRQATAVPGLLGRTSHGQPPGQRQAMLVEILAEMLARGQLLRVLLRLYHGAVF